jgi:hypothetical protein
MKLRHHNIAPVISDTENGIDDSTTTTTDLGPDATRRRKWYMGISAVAAAAILTGGAVAVATSGDETDPTTAPEQLTAAEQFANREDEEAAQETDETTLEPTYEDNLAELGPAPTHEELLETARAPLAMSELESELEIPAAAVEVLDLWLNAGTEDLRTYWEWKIWQRSYSDPGDIEGGIQAFAAERAVEQATPYKQAFFNVVEGYGMNQPTIEGMIAKNQEVLVTWLHSAERDTDNLYEAHLTFEESSNSYGIGLGQQQNTTLLIRTTTNAEALGLQTYEQQVQNETLEGLKLSYRPYVYGVDDPGIDITYLNEDADGIKFYSTSGFFTPSEQ